MPPRKYRLSIEADHSLAAIYEYTFLNFGEAQADTYLLDLHEAFELLESYPFSGRDCSHLRPGLRRFVRGHHVIYYRQTGGGVLIVDILGGGQKPQRHL